MFMSQVAKNTHILRTVTNKHFSLWTMFPTKEDSEKKETIIIYLSIDT